MRILTPEETREVMTRYEDLRVSDIPLEGMLLHNERMILTANREGEITLFSLDPNDE